MSCFPQNAKAPVAALLLAVLLSSFIVLPPKEAEAVVPVNVDFSPTSIGEWILQTITQGKILVEAVTTALKATLIAADTNALVTKEYVLDPLSYVAKLVIRTLRSMVIKWILTGRFEGPAFSTSFIIDAQRAAENASRSVLSQLTGLNLCAGLSIPPGTFFSYNLNLATQCSFTGDFVVFNQGNNFDFGMLAQSEADNNDPQDIALTVLDEKLRAEATARSSFANEYLAGGGFLGIRDPATGKIKTPGGHVKDLLQENVRSLFEEYGLADELLEAIVAIVDTFVQKTINDGLTAAF